VKLLLGTALAATLVLCIHTYEASQSVSLRWKLEWFWSDGIPNVLFLFVLAVMMFLWAPNPQSKLYVYSGLGEDDNADKQESPWADEELDDVDDDSFWKETHATQSKTEGSGLPEVKKESLPADTIGAPVTQEVA